jgi:hypothetical protein
MILNADFFNPRLKHHKESCYKECCGRRYCV